MIKFKVEKTQTSLKLEVRRLDSDTGQFDNRVTFSKFLWSVNFEYSHDLSLERMKISPISSLDRLDHIQITLKLLKDLSGFKYERLYHAILAMGATE